MLARHTQRVCDKIDFSELDRFNAFLYSLDPKENSGNEEPDWHGTCTASIQKQQEFTHRSISDKMKPVLFEMEKNTESLDILEKVLNEARIVKETLRIKSVNVY